jgi:hypothetical protein
MGQSVHDPAHKTLRILVTLFTYCVCYPWRGIPTTIAVAVNARVTGRKQRDKLIQVVIEVRSGTASFRVSVRAHSIRRAISLVRGSYPGSEASLVLPVEPESFFLGDDLDGAEQETFRMPQRLVG